MARQSGSLTVVRLAVIGPGRGRGGLNCSCGGLVAHSEAHGFRRAKGEGCGQGTPALVLLACRKSGRSSSPVHKWPRRLLGQRLRLFFAHGNGERSPLPAARGLFASADCWSFAAWHESPAIACYGRCLPSGAFLGTPAQRRKSPSYAAFYRTVRGLVFAPGWPYSIHADSRHRKGPVPALAPCRIRHRLAHSTAAVCNANNRMRKARGETRYPWRTRHRASGSAGWSAATWYSSRCTYCA